MNCADQAEDEKRIANFTVRRRVAKIGCIKEQRPHKQARQMCISNRQVRRAPGLSQCVATDGGPFVQPMISKVAQRRKRKAKPQSPISNQVHRRQRTKASANSSLIPCQRFSVLNASTHTKRCYSACWQLPNCSIVAKVNPVVCGSCCNPTANDGLARNGP